MYINVQLIVSQIIHIKETFYNKNCFDVPKEERELVRGTVKITFLGALVLFVSNGEECAIPSRMKGRDHLEDLGVDVRIVLKWILGKQKRLDSSVGIAQGYGLDDRGSRVRFPAGAGNFSLHHRVQNGSGAHPASYRMGTGGSFPGGKAAGS
jgi:hypothetical protein